MKTNSIREIWERLATTSGQQIVRERIQSGSFLESYALINGMTGVRMLQIAVHPDAVNPNHVRQFRGVGIHMIPETNEKAFFTILLLDNELADIFTLFVDDLLEKLTPVQQAEEIPSIIYNRINFWRQLFARTTGELLSAEKQQGLFGELYFLEWLLDHQKDALSVVDSWQGASGSAQDFQWNGKAVEIKTSKSKHPQITVSNEQQLDYTLFDQLLLGLLLVFESKGNQQSLFSIIQRIRQRLQDIPGARDLFDLKLDQAGVHPSLEKEYNNISFSVRDMQFFDVREGFPVLIRKTIANEAIHHITYQIDSNACASFGITEEQARTLFL